MERCCCNGRNDREWLHFFRSASKPARREPRKGRAYSDLIGKASELLRSFGRCAGVCAYASAVAADFAPDVWILVCAALRIATYGEASLREHGQSHLQTEVPDHWP